MKEIHLGQILAEHRRRRGITQDELAEHLGVSKTAVSKWETASTYPDITLLPRLAAFFHITIDELMDYRPQMTKPEIRRLYKNLAQDFSTRPFDEVISRCREIVREYFSCPELLFQIACLYVNHCSLAGSLEKGSAVLEEAMTLCAEVREQSGGALGAQAVNMEAFCLLRLDRVQEALELLKNSVPLRMAPEPLLAEAYQMTGNLQEARRVLQAGMYQIMLELLNLQLSYLGLCQEDALDETVRRISSLEKSFRLEALHPGMLLTAHIGIAQEYARRGDREQALNFLERYQKLAVSDIYPLALRGDSYFNLLDGWLEENMTLGGSLPREESAVRKSVQEAPAAVPAFSCLREDPRFQEILRRLKDGKPDSKNGSSL